MSYSAEHAAYLAGCEAALKKVTEENFQENSVVSQAAEYTLMNGGKRVRGVLVQAACAMLGGNQAAAERFAAAIEMVHAFSLVHDDLPCMDDDDMRRGKPAAHIAFGQANALLAGDLLALEAFDVVAGAPAKAEDVVRACGVLAKAAGAKGMIYGQELDLKYEETAADEAVLTKIQEKKTGALFIASVLLGAAAASRDGGDEPELVRYGQVIGRVFQIVDDILDVTADETLLGKPVGSDKQQGKSTFVTVFGLEKARLEVENLTENAVKGLQQAYGEKSAFLCEFARELAARIH